MSTKNTIQNLYETFKSYQLNGKIAKCLCGCISEEAEQKLYAKPLQSLAAEDIGYYSNKAMTTWGMEDDYKHFLPRIIEIYHEDSINGWIDLDSIYHKLNYAKWKDWKENEQLAINKFVEADWNGLVNCSLNQIWVEDFESYLNFLDFDELTKAWTFPQNKIALRNFVVFLHLNLDDLFYSKQVKIKGPDRKKQFADLIQRENLQECLEEEFFKYASTDKKYADKVSSVLQIIENEMNAEG